MANIPKTQIMWTEYHNSKGEIIGYLTSNKDRTTYFIYSYKKGSYELLGKGKSPNDLEKKYKIFKK